MKFTLNRDRDGNPVSITVEREKGDPSLSRGGWTPDGWALESVALGWVMRWLNRTYNAGLIRASVDRDYARGLSQHMIDNRTLLRQPVKTYGKGGPWDVHIVFTSTQLCEHDWGGWQWVNGDPKGAKGAPRPLRFGIWRAS